MDLNLYLAFIAATAILMAIPGPNVALIVATSMARGTRAGLLTVAGTSSAMILQLALVALGLSALLGSAALLFEWLRWIGVAYLLYLGIRQWRAAPVNLAGAPPAPNKTYWRGFFVSLTNPKTLFFYGAFFPQFVSPSRATLPQVAILSATFIALAVLIDSTWAILAARARALLAKSGKLPNRLSGTLLIGAALGLALARKRPA